MIKMRESGGYLNVTFQNREGWQEMIKLTRANDEGQRSVYSEYGKRLGQTTFAS